MIVCVRLFLTARKYASDHQDPAGRVELEMPPGSTLADALVAFGIPDRAGLSILVNGQNPGGNVPLGDGDEVAIFPALAGG
ncbi:MAG: MoaD/ThiS family protein [Actinobacteria bacterium]|nr:MoaD/ThiS family protein [Actinomycetota bacterium]